VLKLATEQRISTVRDLLVPRLMTSLSPPLATTRSGRPSPRLGAPSSAMALFLCNRVNGPPQLVTILPTTSSVSQRPPQDTPSSSPALSTRSPRTTLSRFPLQTARPCSASEPLLYTAQMWPSPPRPSAYSSAARSRWRSHPHASSSSKATRPPPRRS